MSVGFGFSVGDFFAAIKLVHTVVDALSASSHSSSELQDVLRQLHSLETALDEVKNLEVYESLHAEVLALKQSAAQCQRTVTDFLTEIASYQPHLLGISISASHTLCTKWKKVKWALCKKKDLVQFRSNLLAHTESIQLLLTTVQMKNVDLGQKSQRSLQVSLASRVQDGFSSCMRKISVISDTLSRVSTAAHECLENTRRIVAMNIRVFQVIVDVQTLLNYIPGQIERQQPVYLNDALGRNCPFHLEFIKSREALTSVLSINFKWLGSASMKIQNNEFTIHDSGTNRDVNLDCPWEECFLPGQHVAMSMVFGRSKACSTAYTLLVWTQRNGTDMALSFERAEDCEEIWQSIQPDHNQQARATMGSMSPNARSSVPPTTPDNGGNQALRDYQMQLVLLEQQHKKRLLMARQEKHARPLDSSESPHSPFMNHQPVQKKQVRAPPGRLNATV
ncbi:MAG: hypothetical protein Q9218_002952 [Villophora microphyllina]